MKNLSILFLANFIFFSAFCQNSDVKSGFRSGKNQKQFSATDTKKQIPSLYGRESVSEEILINILSDANQFLLNDTENNIVHNLDSIVVDNYERETGDWSRYLKYKYGTEKVGNTEYYNANIWDDTLNEWKSFTINIKEYDSNDSLIHLLEYPSSSLSDTGMTYFQKAEYFYSYLIDGKLEEYIQYQRDFYTGIFSYYRKEIKTFNHSQLNIHSIYEWDKENKKWEFLRRFEYEYDDYGNIISDIDYIQDIVTDTIRGVKKINYENDSIGNNLKVFYYSWDDDDFLWIIDYKQEFTYNDSGDVLSQHNYLWNSDSSDWRGTARTLYGYDDNGNKILVEDSQWDSSLNEWIYQQKGVYQFDENQNRILNAAYIWDMSQNIWIGISKTEEAYNVDGEKLYKADFIWDGESNQWIGSNKEVYSFDDFGNRILSSVYKWDVEAKDWAFNSDRSKSEYVYNGSGKITQKLDMNWNNNQNDWAYYKMYEYEYDNQNRNILYVESNWNSGKQDWINITKKEYAFDEYGNYILDATYNYNSEVDSLILYRKYEHAYDINGRQILSIQMDSYGNPYYLGGSKTEIVYDEEGRFFTMYSSYIWDNEGHCWRGTGKHIYDIDEFGYPLIDTEYLWDHVEFEWFESNRKTYYYTLVSTPEIELGKDNVLVYPNPATNFITFDLSEITKTAIVRLFDINGKLVLSEKLYPNKSISTKGLNSGIYFWKVTAEEEVGQGKIVISKFN
ncbi:MAG: T9SS type A sorting domain-containing protein [Prolixibacteraceae bacterium]|nr:T9SS type A sorting domain-containing protein [Prolixibacteraceae bacterium]